MNLKVSVIIPVYNVEPYLHACLDSVLGSTLREIEVICVDDASSDGSPAILEEYAERDGRITAIYLTENVGQGIARNIGLERARGEYVYFLDSDDMVATDALLALYERSRADALDGILFDSTPVFESDELAQRNASYLGIRKGNYPAGAMTGAELLDLFCKQREWTCYVQRQLWRRGFLEEHGILFPEWSSHEDEAFAFEAMLLAERVAYVREPYFIRRYREGSVMTTGFTLKKLKSYFMCCCRMEEFLARLGDYSIWAEREVFRIYEACEGIYALLTMEGVDVDAGFIGTELEDRYLLFRTSLRSYLRYSTFSQDLLKKLKNAEFLYIYGAGVIGKRVRKALGLLGLVVDAFVVTDASVNPRTLEGHRVLQVDELPDPLEGGLVLISLTDGYRAEVEALLDERGWPHAYYKD